jgi:hypothetical protein
MKRFIVIFLILSSQVNALDLKQAYQEGTEIGTSHANQSIDLLKELDLNKFPGYQSNLSQEHYYSGVTQGNTGIEADSQTVVADNEPGKAVNESFNHRPLYKVNPASESMQKLNQIAENGDAIIHGQNTDKTICSLKPKECHYSWQEKTCLTSKKLGTPPGARNQHYGDEGQNTCDGIINEGCEQIASTCLKEEGGRCKTYQQTYQCPLNQCTDNQLICGEGAFCLEGDCATHEYTPANEDDFKKAMSTLSAASDASKDFDGNANFIFKGQQLECSNVIAGVKNCCRDSGWGIDLNLAHCSDLEKKLGKSREKKLVVPTGEYCFKRKKLPIGSICVEHHETFCVFQSKLARIVQEQGRWGQLHINFGHGKYSNCSGITPEQMQLIHFESINFSEFYDEVKNKLKKPDYKQTVNGISQRLNEFYNQGDING